MYTETQLNDLLKQLESEFAPFLAKAEAETLLAKSEDEGKKPEPKEEGKPENGKAEAEGEKAEGEAEKADGEAKVAAADGEKAAAEAPAEGNPAEGKPEGEAPAEAAPANPDCDYDEDDHAHMADMYGSMSPGELKAHHDAIRKCLDAQGGMAKGNEMPAAAPAAAPEMQKSEKTKAIEVSAETIVAGAESEILKGELAATKAEVEDLKKSSEVMKQFITKLFEKKKAPAGKAITDLGVLEKSEGSKGEAKSFTKHEITKILTAKTTNPTLAKTERDAINAYYTGGQVNVDSIRHLLK